MAARPDIEPHGQLSALSAVELERRAVDAHLRGEDDRCEAAWEAAHERHVESGDPQSAACCSFWLAFCLMMRGQMARAGGWLARSEAVIDDDDVGRANGFLVLPALVGALERGEPAAARDLALHAEDVADRFDEPDLRALASLGLGQALVALEQTAEGVACFDEVMLSVTSGEVGPIATGVVYCAVILECMAIFDLRRAAEWTEALDAWCADRPGLVRYRGQCLVHRSQIQQAAGDWTAAVATVIDARRRLTTPPHPALGPARYQEAELHRLRGRIDAAEEGYRAASAQGREPMPGLALLDLARGDRDAAAAGIRRALQENGSSTSRLPFLAAAVDVFHRAGDLAAARSAGVELDSIANADAPETLQAMAGHAMGVVLLAEGEVAEALVRLRRAHASWTRLRMPYDSARTAVVLGLCCLAVGDRTSAGLEFENARRAFESMDAQPDLDRLRAVMTAGVPSMVAPPSSVVGRGLSGRELEVLAHVARGQTNREIAEALVISPHTVGRHLENIFAKLGVRGRAAATAYGYEHDLL